MIFRHVSATVVLLTIVVDAALVRGEPTKTEVAVARRHFEEAQIAEQEGRWRDAVEELNRAISIKETAGLRYHLGYAKENLGLLVDALLEYQRAQGLIRSGVTNEEVERFLTPKLKELHGRVPTVTVLLKPELNEQAELQIDGITINRALLGSPMPVNPGTHELAVLVPGYRPFRARITVGEGSSVKQVAELVPNPVLRTQSERTITDISPGARTGQSLADNSTKSSDSQVSVAARTWLLIGEGAIFAAGLATGVSYTASARSAENRIAQISGSIAAIDGRPDACGSPSPQSNLANRCAELSSAATDRDRARDRAAAGFVAAGVGGAALALTWVLWKPNSLGSPQIAVVPGSIDITVTGHY